MEPPPDWVKLQIKLDQELAALVLLTKKLLQEALIELINGLHSRIALKLNSLVAKLET